MKSLDVRRIAIAVISCLAFVASMTPMSAAEKTKEPAAVIEVTDAVEADSPSQTPIQPADRDGKVGRPDVSKRATADRESKPRTPTLAKRPSNAGDSTKLARRETSPRDKIAIDGSTAGPASPSAPADEAEMTVADDLLTPIPDSQGDPQRRRVPAEDIAAEQFEPVAIEATSFKGVIPGVSTKSDVETAWGPAKRSTTQDGALTQLHAIDPFKHIEVNIVNDRVASIVIRFERAFPADAMARQLDLAKIRPVMVTNDLGEVLGLAYPERGVLFSFEPNQDSDRPSANVNQIALEPITAEPFVLRAETIVDSRPSVSRLDAEQALKLDPGNARAYWLLGRVLFIAEDHGNAMQAANEAVQLQPDNPHYLVTRGQILGQLGRVPEAVQDLQKAAEMAESRPHVKARALCLQGDLLASGPKPDYRQAVALHTQAIQVADALTSDPHPAIRLAAKDVLVDGHLGAARDIAYGEWKDKVKAVARWLERAAAAADDLVVNEGGGEEQLFRVHAAALDAYAGMRGSQDPARSAKEAKLTGERLIAACEDPLQKTRYERVLGKALHNAMQVFQMRAELAEALEFGEAALAYLEKEYAEPASPADAALMGRLYFRLGLINVKRDQNHSAAVAWFEKAIPLLDRPMPKEVVGDLGRYGEMFVSMGIAYWEVGQREDGVKLTQKGIAIIERGVQQNLADQSTLAVPYHNLATMYRKLGTTDLADHFQDMASRIKSEKLK